MVKPVYVALGDSLSAGAGDGDNPYLPGVLHEPVGWARRLWYLLDSRAPSRAMARGWDFTDLATGGARIDEVILEQLPQLLRRKPDFITLAVGMNDITEAQFSEDRWDTLYRQLLEYLCEDWGGWTPVVMTVTFPMAARLLAIDPENEEQVALMAWRQGCITGSVLKHSADNGAIVCDLATQLPLTRELFSEDGVHPSREGHLAWAHIAYQTLTEGGW